VGAAAFAVLARPLGLAPPARGVLDALLRTVGIAALSWAMVRGVGLLAAGAVERLSRAGTQDPSVRGRVTQVLVLRRIADAVVLVVASALVLLQFDSMRSLGTSVLASAGIAGIVVGFAAQRTIATLLAGLQISLTQPVRVGDVVVIEGEWGTVEEITLTYVVVKVWDLRRLVVPITRILEAPFQNWTRTGSAILGTAYVRADHRVPVEAVRGELERFVATRPEWDRQAVGLQVTDASERSVELRALVSAADAGAAWNLRCAVREHLLAFLQRLDGGAYLPKVRIEPVERASPRNTVVPPQERAARE
jgi:small-conductance mechanosensitive channel